MAAVCLGRRPQGLDTVLQGGGGPALGQDRHPHHPGHLAVTPLWCDHIISQAAISQCVVSRLAELVPSLPLAHLDTFVATLVTLAGQSLLLA